MGGTTPSYDLETEINNNYETKHLTENLIYNTANQFLIGEIDQKPPIFSAIKKNGEKTLQKSKKREKISIESRKVNIQLLKLIPLKI